MYGNYNSNTWPCFILTGTTWLAAPSRCVPRLATENGYLYLTTFHDVYNSTVRPGGITRVSTTTGATTSLLSLPSSTPFLTVDRGTVYFADSAAGAIKRMPVTGGTPSVVTTLASDVAELVVSGETLYWIERTGTNTAIMSAPLAGGTATVRAAGLVNFTHSLVTDGTVMYVIHDDGDPTSLFYRAQTGGELRRYGLPDFSMQVIAQQASDVALDDQSVYWASRANLSSIKKAAN